MKKALFSSLIVLGSVVAFSSSAQTKSNESTAEVRNKQNTGSGDLTENKQNTGSGGLTENKQNTGSGDLTENKQNTGSGDLTENKQNTGIGDLMKTKQSTGNGVYIVIQLRLLQLLTKY